MKLVVDEQGNPALGKVWVSPDGGTSPIVANSVLYVAATGVIRAIDPLTGALLWKNNSVGRIHWSSPILANGVLYITDESGHLTAFTLEKG
jgi:outer membrane protein assembly factor BamB